jgi:hypothetical protein
MEKRSFTTPRFALTAPVGAPFSSARSLTCSRTRILTPKLREFDSETETLYIQLQKQQNEDLDQWERDWLFSHADQWSRINAAMGVRDVGARAALTSERDLLLRQHAQLRAEFVRNQQRAGDDFFANRQKSRKLAEGELTSQSAPEFTKASTQRITPSLASPPRKPQSSFLPCSRGKFIESSIRVGRFPKKPSVKDDGDDDLFDMANLQRILDGRAYRHGKPV